MDTAQTITRYSQQEEQDYILEAVKSIQEGTVLDIGAWDPFTFSNSRALIEKGWRGVLVEPSPEPLTKLVKEYGTNPNIHIYAGLAAVEDVYEDLYVTADAVSTTNKGEYDKWKNATHFHGILTYRTIPIETLVTLWQPDFITIDAEGTSVEMFLYLMRMIQHSQMGRNTLKVPTCICVEHNGEASKRLIPAAAANGYQMIHLNNTNVIFAR